MSIIYVTETEAFEQEVLKAEGTVLVDFYADWCGPCKALAPILDEVAKETEGKIVKVNVDEVQELAQKYRVMSIPTLIQFVNGEEKETVRGLVSKQKVLEMVK